MYDTIERIMCAANWYKELPTPVHRPKNIERGIVFSGRGHAHCLGQMCAITGKRQHEVGEYEEGFLTTHNRFVDRIEAGRIAIDTGQISKLHYSDKLMYSEDLFRTD